VTRASVVTRVHPGFVVPDPHGSADFFERFFAFRRTTDRPEYVQVRRDDVQAEIGFVLAGLLASPTAFRPEFTGAGAWLTIEVADLEATLALFMAADYPLVEPLADRSFGERHFVVRAPGGILVNVVARDRSYAADKASESSGETR
jgi:catechol 2,3-dioxygenase-like lactoylglutathione lyase family enzyme